MFKNYNLKNKKGVWKLNMYIDKKHFISETKSDILETIHLETNND